MIDLADKKTFVFAVNHRIMLRDALEAYRLQVTKRMFNDVPSMTEYHDIELDEIDEILEQLGEQE
jgi:hypothetical protein